MERQSVAIAQVDEELENLSRKLTLKRIGMRQGHALSTVRTRKNVFDAFQFKRSNWSNVRGTKGGLGSLITNSLALGNNTSR